VPEKIGRKKDAISLLPVRGKERKKQRQYSSDVRKGGGEKKGAFLSLRTKQGESGKENLAVRLFKEGGTATLLTIEENKKKKSGRKDCAPKKEGKIR